MGTSHTLLVSQIVLPPTVSILICLPFSLVCPVSCLRNMPVQPPENNSIFYLFPFNDYTPQTLDFTGFFKNFSTKKVLKIIKQLFHSDTPNSYLTMISIMFSFWLMECKYLFSLHYGYGFSISTESFQIIHINLHLP